MQVMINPLLHHKRRSLFTGISHWEIILLFLICFLYIQSLLNRIDISMSSLSHQLLHALISALSIPLAPTQQQYSQPPSP